MFSRSVFINGIRLSDRALAGLEQQYGLRIEEGEYWYDRVGGAWGKQGGPTLGWVLPGLPLDGVLRQDASNGNTGVIINGRELQLSEVLFLQQFGPVWPGRYFVDAFGNFGFEGGFLLGNLGALRAASRPCKEGILSTYDKCGMVVI